MAAGKLLDWLDHRTGYRAAMDAMLLEHVPGGARWRYVWGSTLVFVFTLQLVTGLLLMTAYSPSDTTAWASVHFIQYQMDFGWLIRGLHHFGSQTMMVLIALHMLQVVLAGAQLPPREFNWWLGMGLLGVTFGLSLTGYLLPWDQKGYWATRVATNIAGTLPSGGPFIQQVAVGGPDYGNHTLTRFFALHVGILPLTLIVLLVFHIAMFRRHGVTAPANVEGQEYFWPGQVFRDWIACLLVFGVMLAAVLGAFGKHGNEVTDPNAPPAEEQTLYDYWAHAGQRGLGANLDAPADRDTADYPARPEWYFLFLFQLLKYFEGPLVQVGTFYIPNGVFLLLFLLPVFGYGRMRNFGYWFGVIVMVLLLLGAAVLTVLAFAADSPEWAPTAARLEGKSEEDQKKAGESAADLHKKMEKAHVKSKRAAQLAMSGVPDDGARQLLRNDPYTTGHELFKNNCAVCHKFTARPDDPFEGFTGGPFKAADLGDFASEKWIRGLLHAPDNPMYFGLTPLEGMKNWKAKVLAKRERLLKKDPEGAKKTIAKEEEDFDVIARWLADQANPADKRNKDLHPKAAEAFGDRCGSCHAVKDVSEGETAPDLTNYGSQDWVRGMIMAPGAKSRYGRSYAVEEGKERPKGLMPAFRNLDGPGADVHLEEFHAGQPDFPRDLVIGLSDVDREMIVRFMTRDPRVVFGGRAIAGPKR